MTPSFVVDASVAMAWCFADEETPVTQGLLKDLRSKVALVPAWWYVEIANVVALAERKGRLSVAEIDGFLAVLDG
jgi:predicted nucleic acid-binding protein